ncbi:MAG: glutamine amidotransferase-related protein [Gammaproteobacteria bacterium]
MILIINNYQDYPALLNLREALDKCGQQYRIKGGNESIDVDELDMYQGIILSGGPGHVKKPMDFEEFKLNFKVMIYATVPILGICFGHQIMAKGSGVNIGQWEDGMHYYMKRKITILENKDLFEGFEKGQIIEALVAHSDYVADIPSNATLTATVEPASASEFDSGIMPSILDNLGEAAVTLMEVASLLESPTKIQGLTYDHKKFYSTQFHPELSGDDGLKILNNFFAICRCAAED